MSPPSQTEHSLASLLVALSEDPDNVQALAQLSHLAGLATNSDGTSAAHGDPELVRALAEATRLHRERGDFELCVRLIDLAIAAEPDTEKKADLAFDQGRLYSDELLRDDDAVKAFERALELRPGDETAEDALGHISLVRDNWQKILHKYLDEAKGSTDRQLTSSLYLSVSELYAKFQANATVGTPPVSQTEKFLRQALEVDPRNLKASARLERLLRQSNRIDDLAALFEQRAEAAPSREDRVLAYLSLADLERRRGKVAEAAEANKKVLGIDPTNARALGAIVEHYTETQAWQPLIRVYENALRARPRGEPEIGTLLQIAMIWWKKLENLDAADEYWKRIRKADPGHPAMLEFYRVYHGGDAGKLLPILQQAQRLSGDDEKGLDLALETARAAQSSKGANERAIDLWKNVLRIAPGHPEAVSSLEKLYERTEKWNALLELHKEALEALGKQDAAAGGEALVEAKLSRLQQIAAIYRDRLALEQMVTNTYAQMLQLRPDHRDALIALAQRYEASGGWNNLITVLQRRADITSELGEKSELLRRIADLWVDKFGNLHQAVRPLEELWALDPKNADVVVRLRDLYTRRRAWRALLDLERKEEQRLAEIGDAPARRAKLIEIAKLTAERLGDAPEAIAAWNRLLELDVSDPEALTALSALYEREKRWPALVEILRRQAQRSGPPTPGTPGTPDERQRVTLLERAANLLIERLEQPERAAELYREILQLQPTHARATRILQGLFAQAGQLDELVALYARGNQWDELFEVLQQTAERLPPTDTARRTEILLRAAELATTQLRNPDKAARAYERILALDAPDSTASPTGGRSESTRSAARALLAIYRAQEKWARLLATYEVLLGFSTSVDEQLAMIREIRELCEDKLGSRGLAFAWAARAYGLKPSDASLERDLERLAEAAETWDELVEIYAGELAATPPPTDERRLSRLRRLADIAYTRQHKLDDARRHYEQILTLAEGDAEALAALERLFGEGQSFPQLLLVYRQRDASWRGGENDSARIDLLFKIVWLQEEKLTDFDAARETLQRIRGLAPGGPTELRALRSLERIEVGGGKARLAALAQVLERQLELSEHDDASVDILARLAIIYAEHLSRSDDALDRLERALSLDPDRRATHLAIENLLDAKGTPALTPANEQRALALLVPAFEERLKTAAGDELPRTAARLITLIERQLSATTAGGPRLQLLTRLSLLAEDAPQSKDLKRRRYEWAAERFEADPGSRELRHAVLELGASADRIDDVAVRLGKLEAASLDAKLKRDLAIELGALFEGPLGMRSDAALAYRRVLDADPNDTVAENALERIFKADERYGELRALYVARKERALDAGRRADLVQAICDLDEGVLDDREAAIASYRELLEIDPHAPRAFRALERLYTTEERFAEVEALLAAREAFQPSPRDQPEVRGTPESRAHFRYRRAELFRDRLNDLSRAVDLYEEALAEEPTHEGSRRALEALLRKAEVRLRVARVLQPLYEADEAWPKLALVLGAERESLEGLDAVPLLTRLAALQEDKLGARQLALSTWREALRIEPRDEQTRAAVERLAVLLGRHADLAAAWDEAYLASDPSDLPLRAELLQRSARLYERELRDSQKAAAAWRRLFDLDSTNAELGKPAAEALERLYESEEAWGQLVGVLRRRVEWTGEPDARRQLLFRIARIQEELLVDPGAAIETYRELLEADPSDRGALDGLEKLYAAKSEWSEMREVLRRRIDLENDPKARRDLLYRIAQLTERELADPEKAVSAYGAVLDESASDVPSLDALSRLHEAAGRKIDLLEVLERRIALEETRLEGEREKVRDRNAPRDERNLAGLRMRAAAVELEVGRTEAAVERYREILDRDPKHEGALRGLEPMLSDPSLRLRAAEILEPRYRELDDSARLLGIHELIADASPDLRERVSRLQRAAELRVASGDRDAAFDALARAARLSVAEPDLPLLLDKLEAATTVSAGARLVTLYRDLGPDILDAGTQERVQLSVAAESERLGDRSTAREYYRRVLDASPDNPRALAALEAIYQAGEEWSALYEVYVRRGDLAAQTGDEDTRRRYLLLGAKLCENRLARPDDAIPAYEEALLLQPADAETSRALEMRYTATKRWHELAELLEKRLNFADEVEEAVALRVQLAELFDHELMDPDRAVDNYRAALGGDPSHVEAIKALERYLEDPTQGAEVAEVLEPVYVARHDWPRLVRVCEVRLEAAEDPRVRLALYRRIARIYEEQLEDLEGAFGGYTKVYREDPTDRATRDQLSRLAGVLDGWERLATVYEEHLASVGPEGDGAHDALRALASIYHERLADVDRARGAYARLLERDRNDELAFISLEKLLERAARWPELLDAYREAATHTLDTDVRRRLLHKAATVAEQRLSDLDVAIQLHIEVMELDPADATSPVALERLYRKAARWHDLVELIENRVSERAADDIDGWTADKLILAELRSGPLEDTNTAIEVYEEVLGRKPREVRAVRVLEKIIVEPEHTYRVAQILGPIYRAEGSWQKLIVIHEAELEYLDDPEDRYERLTELAGLHEQHGNDRRRAFNALVRAWRDQAALGDDPDGREREASLFAELSRIAEAEKMFAELCDELEKAVTESTDLTLRSRVYRRVAELSEQKLSDRSRAIAAYEHVLAAEENDQEAWAHLERLLAAENRSRDLVRALEKRTALTDDADLRKQLHRRAAFVYEEQLRDGPAAIGAWRLLLDVDSDDQEALYALARLHRARGEHEALADILDRLVDTASDVARRRALRAELGALAAGPLSDAARASEAWRAILADANDDREALVELRSIELHRGQHPDALEVTDQLIEITPAGNDRDLLRIEAAELLESKLADAPSAIDRYAAVLNDAASPEGVSRARAALDRLVRERDTRAAASAVLLPTYEKSGEWSAYIELGELAIADEQDPAERRAWLAKMAQAAERGLSDGKAAFTLWARAFREEPADADARNALERLVESEAIPGELARVYEEMLTGSLAPEVGHRLALRLGELYEQKVGDEERAIVSYTLAMSISGTGGGLGDDPNAERNALAALDRLLSRAGRPRELAEVLQKRAEAADADAERVLLWHRLGVLLAGELIDLDGALTSFRDALELDPGHEPSRVGMEALLDSEPHREAALDVLEPIAERDHDVPRQNALSERRLTTLADDHEKGALLERIAERAEQSLADPKTAFSAIARALALEPASERLAEECERIATSANAKDQAAELFERLATDGDAPAEVKRELALRAGKVWEALGKSERAEARYQAVLSADRDDADALESLERVYRVRGEPGRLADVLTRRAAIELDAEQKKALYAEAAQLAERSLADVDGAVDLWRQVLGVDDTDEAAVTNLGRLLEQRGRWLELADHLTQAASVTDDARARAGMLSRIASISAERMSDLPRAIAALRELLDLEPEAMAALDSLIDLEDRRLAAHGLESRRGDELALKDALERKLGAVPDGPERIPIFRRLAEVAQKRGDVDDALGYLYEIVALDPADAAAHKQQETLLEKAERWSDLVDVLSAEAGRVGALGEVDAELRLLVRAADVWEEKLESPESAAEVLERILARDKGNVRALLSLARIAERGGDSERALEMLAGAEATAKVPEEIAELAFRRGKVEADAGNADAAVAHFARALQSSPQHLPSLEALTEHARQTDATAELARLLELQLVVASVEGQTALRNELVRVYLGKLAAPDCARPHLEAVLAATPATAPGAAQAREQLADLHFMARRLEEAKPLYTALVEAATQARRRGKEVARLHSRLGEIAEKSGDVPGALASFAEAQKLDASHAPTLVALARLQVQKQDWEAARKLYRSLLLQNLDASAGISKTGVYVALGEIHERLNEAPKAVGMYERALELDAGNEAVRASLARLRGA